MRTTVTPIAPRTARRPRRRGQGQALVEFALAAIPFLILLMAVVDLGRGIYALNGTSEAARIMVSALERVVTID